MSKINIVISRTDSIGDVILTLPITGYLKEKFPNCKIFFLGKTYTRDIISISSNVDTFINWDTLKVKSNSDQIAYLRALQVDWFIHVFPNKQIAKLAKKAGIPNRIGTSHRMYHLLTCNKLVSFSRKKSDLHEAQLNLKLLKPLEIKYIPAPEDLAQYYGIDRSRLSADLPIEPLKNKVNVILHPKSKGSAREWGLDNYGKLIDLIPKDKYKIYISGTSDDKKHMQGFLDQYAGQVEDITGKLSLQQFIAFIARADALVAASTGPLHIASCLGIKAIGIYPPIRPMHPERWSPIGEKSQVLVLDKKCNTCRKSTGCECMSAIKPDEVLRILNSIKK